MRPRSIRMTVEIPAPLYRELKERAAAQGHSVRDLVLAGVRGILFSCDRPRPKRVRFPLIVSKGPEIELISAQIYRLVGFP